MGFKISYSENEVSTGFGIVEEGKYEVTIVSAEPNEWQGNYSIKFGVEIRSDFTQKHQGAKVLYNDIYMSPGMAEYEDSRKQKMATFLKACGHPAGKEIDLEDLARNIIGKGVLAYVKHKEDKEGKKWPRVTFVAPSAVAGIQVSNSGGNNKGPIEVSQDDLPF